MKLNLGLGMMLSRTHQGGGGGPVQVNPNTLPLSGYWEASYTAVPWTGTASTGSSSGKNLSGQSANPSAGTAVSTYTPASLNGTTQSLYDTTNTTDTYITTTEYTVSMLVKPASAATDAGVPYNNPGLMVETGGNWGIVYSTAGVEVYHVSATEVSHALGTGSWAQVDVRFSAGNVSIRVNKGTWTTQAAVATGAVTGQFRIGRNFNSVYLAGDVLSVAVSLTALSDASLDGVYEWRKARYPGAGLPSVTPINPASLNLSLLHLASYGGSPWAGTASAGASGSNTLSEGTNPATVGTAVNSFTPAEFDGTDDYLQGSAAGSTAMPGAGGVWSAWALVNADTLMADQGQAYLHPALVGNNSIQCLLAVYAGGVDALVETGAGYKRATATGTSAGTWMFAQARFTGTTIEARLNGGAWVSTATGAMTAAGGNVQVGRNYSGGSFLDGKMLAVGFCKTEAHTTGTFDGIRAHLLSVYGV